jgi:CBS-domain-containing membrane protein
MNLLFMLTPKQDVLFVYEDFTLRQTLEKWSNQRYATIPLLKRNGEYVGTITEGDLLWGIKNLHGLDLDASEDVPISSFQRRRDYKAVPVTTDMPTLQRATIDQNFVPVVDDRNVFIGIVRRNTMMQYLYKNLALVPEPEPPRRSKRTVPLH